MRSHPRIIFPGNKNEDETSFAILSGDVNSEDEFQIDSSDEDPSELGMMKKVSSKISNAVQQPRIV